MDAKTAGAAGAALALGLCNSINNYTTEEQLKIMYMVRKILALTYRKHVEEGVPGLSPEFVAEAEAWVLSMEAQHDAEYKTFEFKPN